MLILALAGVAWLAAPTTITNASGRVVTEEGTPIAGARVCELTQGTAERCILTDDLGTYSLSRTTHPKLVVQAKGFVAITVDAAPLNDPVVLAHAATLLVSVVDQDSGQPILSGRVMIDTPSGRRIGTSVPFNASGVRISTLEPGTVFVRSESSGYDPGGPTAVDLVKGGERSVRVTMKKKLATPGTHGAKP